MLLDYEHIFDTSSDFRLSPASTKGERASLEQLGLAKEHIDLLNISNGLDYFGGYYRLFGADKDKPINLYSWNSEDLWRFSWADLAQDYYFFGMTAIGDQFAYKMDDNGQILRNEICYLDGITMDEIYTFSDFNEFFSKFIDPSTRIIEDIFIEARESLGDLDLNTSLVYVPSQFLDDNLTVEHLVKMPTISAMIINGDLCRQLIDTEEEVESLEPYTDEQGRERIKVIW